MQYNNNYIDKQFFFCKMNHTKGDKNANATSTHRKNHSVI